MLSDKVFDAVIIGGGFYGCIIAIYLAEKRGLKNIVILEREHALLTRASYNNQARVHNGYHYPRSFTTAYRSRVNLPKFVADWPFAVKKDFTKLYAIARRNSKVTASQFYRFCQQIGAYIEPATKAQNNLFSAHLIEKVYQVHEYAFDAAKIADWISKKLMQLGVCIVYETKASEVLKQPENNLRVVFCSNNEDHCIDSRLVLNCTYSGINKIKNPSGESLTKLKHEITEMGLVELPDPLLNYGITVMDGPFFSIMPFPARSLHTISHVRYTPHTSWVDAAEINPYDKLAEYHKHPRVDRMIRDTARYIPLINEAKYTDSLFEVKTVLVKNEGDDGRPILFETNRELGNYITILGGKIDNIYDVLERLDNEYF